MASTLLQLAQGVLQRLEEDPNSPQFWQLAGEIFVYLVEAQNEAMLISGEPQARSAAVPLIINSTIQPMPSGAVCILRVESAGALSIRKTSVWDLDRFTPGWENDVNTTPGANPDFWFPIGLTQWGIHPQLTVPSQVIISYLAVPVPTGRPYTGTEVSPYQTEYEDALQDYAAAVCRLKEGGAELQEAMQVYDRFVKKMAELTKFATRKGSLRFTRTVGSTAGVTPVEVR